MAYLPIVRRRFNGVLFGPQFKFFFNIKTNKMKPSQNVMILNHLISRGPLTALLAFKKYDCLRLAARIKDLRNNGHNIKTTIVTNQGKNYALYEYVHNV